MLLLPLHRWLTRVCCHTLTKPDCLAPLQNSTLGLGLGNDCSLTEEGAHPIECCCALSCCFVLWCFDACVCLGLPSPNPGLQYMLVLGVSTSIVYENPVLHNIPLYIQVLGLGLGSDSTLNDGCKRREIHTPLWCRGLGPGVGQSVITPCEVETHAALVGVLQCCPVQYCTCLAVLECVVPGFWAWTWNWSVNIHRKHVKQCQCLLGHCSLVLWCCNLPCCARLCSVAQRLALGLGTVSDYRRDTPNTCWGTVVCVILYTASAVIFSLDGLWLTVVILGQLFARVPQCRVL